MRRTLAACGTAVALLVGACGGADSNLGRERAGEVRATPPSADPQATAMGDRGGENGVAGDRMVPEPTTSVQATLDDYVITVATTSVPPGQVTFSVANEGSVQHDLAVLATELAPERLPTTGIRIDEDSPQLDVLGRTSTMRPGNSGTLSVSVERGSYVLVCTVPHHYVRSRMMTTLSVG